MNDAIKYIIEFLLHDNRDLVGTIGYTSDVQEFSKYKVVIIPSAFFNKEIYGQNKSLPTLPLKQLDGTPILYGDAKTERLNNTIIVNADIIASTYFLITRYEEFIHPNDNRDEHGRYIGKQSLPYMAGFIKRPIVDEYSNLLLKYLSAAGCDIKPTKSEIKNIYLTHDIDFLTHYRSLRGFLGGIKRNLFSPSKLCKVLKSTTKLENDPDFTYPWILEQDRKIENAKLIYFVKSVIKQDASDYPNYNLKGKDFTKIKNLLQKNNCKFGLHTSYFSGSNLAYIAKEKQKLEQSLNFEITFNRWHFLRALQPDDYQHLEQSGITDDFSLGYADVAGFRLGTARPVHWINPKTFEVGKLLLHPLSAMDCTFSNSNYMNLSENEAFEQIKDLLNEIKKYNGEVVLLWHNSIFTEDNYHKSLYIKIINKLERNI